MKKITGSEQEVKSRSRLGSGTAWTLEWVL